MGEAYGSHIVLRYEKQMRSSMKVTATLRLNKHNRGNEIHYFMCTIKISMYKMSALLGIVNIARFLGRETTGKFGFLSLN